MHVCGAACPYGCEIAERERLEVLAAERARFDVLVDVQVNAVEKADPEFDLGAGSPIDPLDRQLVEADEELHRRLEAYHDAVDRRDALVVRARANGYSLNRIGALLGMRKQTVHLLVRRAAARG